MGFINLSINTETENDSMAKPAAHVGFEMRPLLPEFSIGGEGVSSLPSISKSNYFTHTESVGYLGYTFGNDKKFSVEPRAYGYMADGISQKLQFFYTLNIFAIGGELKYKISETNVISCEGFFMSSANQSIRSVRASWGINRPNGSGWGVVGTYSQAGVNLKTANFGIATQTFIGPYINF